MDQLEIVDVSTLLRGKPLKTPLSKKRIRASNPKVQTVARSPKTPHPPVNDDVAPDTDSDVTPVARAPGQNTPQSIAPSFSQLDIVHISTLPRGKQIETPLCKKRIRAWNPKVQSVARSPKTPDQPADDNAAPDTDSHVPPVARAPRQNTPQSTAPTFSQLEIVDISTLPRGKPLETPLCKKRIRAWNPKVQSVARSPKTPDQPADDNAAPDTDSHVPPVARAPRQNTPQSIAPSFSQKVQSVTRSPKTLDTTADDHAATNTDSHVPPVASSSRLKKSPTSIAPSFSQLEIVDISTLLRGKPLETPLGKKSKKRKRAWSPKVQSVERSSQPPNLPADDNAAPDTDSHVPPVASSSPLKISPPSKAPTNQKVKSISRSIMKMIRPSVVRDATPAAGFSHRRPKYRLIHQLEIVDISTLLRSQPIKTPLRKKRTRKSAWSPEVQSVARSPKTLDPPVDDNAASDNSSLPPEASSSPPKNTPLSLAPNTCNFEIVDMSTPPISKELETPLYKNKRRWIMKVKCVGRSTKKMVPSVVCDATPATNSCLTPAAGFSHRRRSRPSSRPDIPK